MKKIIIALILLLVGITNVSAQENDFQKTLTLSKWKVDIETMKPSMLLKFDSIPEMRELTDEEKQRTFDTIILSLSMMRYEFSNDGTFTVIIGSTILKGKYSIKENNTELDLKYDSGEIDSYRVVDFKKNKLHLNSKQRNNDLLLITEN